MVAQGLGRGGMLRSELPSSQKFTGGVQMGTTCPERVSESLVESWKCNFIGLIQFQVKMVWVRRAGLQTLEE